MQSSPWILWVLGKTWKNIHFGHAFSGNSRRAIAPTPRQAGNVVAMQILGTGLGFPVRMIWAHCSVSQLRSPQIGGLAKGILLKVASI